MFEWFFYYEKRCILWFKCEAIAPTIVKKIEGGFDPQTACKDIRLCADTFSGLNAFLFITYSKNEFLDYRNAPKKVLIWINWCKIIYL